MSPLKGKCPICGKPVDPAEKPFCSARCREVDLHRWLTEGYRIPGRAEDDAASDETS